MNAGDECGPSASIPVATVPTLRMQADVRLSNTSAASAAIESLSEEKLREVVHELQVHQIELEIQNEELRQAKLQIENAHVRYRELYDNAPAGYCTVDQTGNITQANLKLAGWLGMARPELPGRAITRFIFKDDQDVYYLLKKRLLGSADTQSCQLRLLGQDEKPMWVQLVAAGVWDEAGNPALQIVLSDIASLKKTQQQLSDSEQRLGEVNDQLRRLSAHQEEIREDERKRIAREIHDELGQNLLALRIDVSMLHTRTGQYHPKLHQRTEYALASIDRTIKSVRSIMNNLRPAVLDLGILSAFSWQVKEFKRISGIECQLMVDESGIEQNEARDTALFRILQESLTNVARHAQAHQVAISLHRNGDAIELQVSDDGVGIHFASEQSGNSYGLMGIKERISAFGGSFAVQSGPGYGVALLISIPAETNKPGTTPPSLPLPRS